MTLYTLTDDYHGGVLDFESASDLALALSENMPGYIWLIIGEPDNEEPVNNPITMEKLGMLQDCLNETIDNLWVGEQMKIWGKTITRVQ